MSLTQHGLGKNPLAADQSRDIVRMVVSAGQQTRHLALESKTFEARTASSVLDRSQQAAAWDS